MVLEEGGQGDSHGVVVRIGVGVSHLHLQAFLSSVALEGEGLFLVAFPGVSEVIGDPDARVQEMDSLLLASIEALDEMVSEAPHGGVLLHGYNIRAS